jgi:hypothetical protein
MTFSRTLTMYVPWYVRPDPLEESADFLFAYRPPTHVVIRGARKRQVDLLRLSALGTGYLTYLVHAVCLLITVPGASRGQQPGGDRGPV